MVRHEMAFENSAVLLGGQGVENLAQTGTNGAVENFSSHFGNEDEMILAVPLGMGQTVVGMCHRWSPFVDGGGLQGQIVKQQYRA